MSSTARPAAARARGPWGRRGRDAAVGYLFLSPTLTLLVVYVAVPLVGAFLVSLQRTNGFGSGVWVGLDNYARLGGDPVFWRALATTFAFTAVVTPLSMAIGLGLAVLMNSVLPGRGLFRSLLVVPMSVSGVATALVGVLMFDENTGILDRILRAVGLPTIHWQSHGGAAFAAVVLMTLWWRAGFNMVVYLAGLQGIDPAVTEASRLDGATPWQTFRFVTVPMLSPSSFFLLVMNMIFSFQVFDLVFVMTGGGPENATNVLVTYAYDNGFVTRDQGYAATLGMVLFVITLGFTALQWRLNREDAP